jgi:phosphoglycolate phosphatase
VPFVAERIRGLVFDLDGTLIDSYRAIAASLNAARAMFGLEPLPTEVVRRHVGRGLEQLAAELVGPHRVEAGVSEFRRRYAELYAALTFALPGVPETLRRLGARGYRMAVASNKPARFSEPILRQLGLRRWFDAVHGPDTAGATKPEPRMIELCLSAMGLRPLEGAYVGDMPLDSETADRARVAVLLVPGGSADGTELAATGRTRLRSFAELLDLLPGTPAAPESAARGRRQS